MPSKLVLSLILAQHSYFAPLTKPQVEAIRRCVDDLGRDPAVKAIYGINARSPGCIALCDVRDASDAERLAVLMQSAGLSNAQIFSLQDVEPFLAGLEDRATAEAEKASTDGSLAADGPLIQHL